MHVGGELDNVGNSPQDHLCHQYRDTNTSLHPKKRIANRFRQDCLHGILEVQILVLACSFTT
jgi:hypothetical protein